MTEPKKLFLLYDARAWHDVNSAVVYCCADTEEEAVRDTIDFPDAVIYEYEIGPGDKLINEKARFDLNGEHQYLEKFGEEV